MKENLAQQHFQVKTAEMNGADEEEIYSEKIAEQQLRIKKVLYDLLLLYPIITIITYSSLRSIRNYLMYSQISRPWKKESM